MADGKNKIIVYKDWHPLFEQLTDEEAGQLIKHFFRYVNDLEPESPNRIIDISFEPIKQTIKRDLRKWENVREEKVKSGLASAEKRKQNQQPLTDVENSQRSSTDSTVKVSVNVSDSVKEKVDSVAAKAAALEKSKNEFIENLKPFSQQHGGQFPVKMMNAFYSYWTEKNHSGTKMRFQLEKTFEISRRLVTWANREK
jgi:predicted transcriptional regulator